MPPGGDEKRMIAFIMENKARLVKALQKHPARPLLDERSELQATTFRLHIFRTERSNFYMRLEDGVLHIACPNETRFEEEEVQSLLKSMLEKALRHEAKRLLPERITLLARQHGFRLTGVKINNSKTTDISLYFFIFELPPLIKQRIGILIPLFKGIVISFIDAASLAFGGLCIIA